MRVPEIDRKLGLEGYLTRTPGIGGRIRSRVEDFIVEEIGEDGTIYEVGKEYKFETEKVDRYLTILLEKHDWDTFMLLETLARKLGVEPDRFSVGGLKDKRAVTIQRISVWGILPEKVLSIRIPGVFIRGLWFSSEKMEPSKVLGNRFRITIRDLHLAPDEIKKRVSQTYQELAVNGGAPNFYGYQRFGLLRPVNHKVGRLLLKGDIKGAVIAFLTETSEHETEECREARRRLLEELDFKRAEKELPRSMYFERMVIRVLSKRPNAYVSAIRALPLSIRKMFIGAFSSYLFNRILSRRLREGTLRSVLTGDHVVELLDRYGAIFGKIVRATDTNKSELQKLVDEGRGTILLPVMGFKIYKSVITGEAGEIVREILEEEEVDPERFKLKQLSELSFPGHFRMAIARISDFDFELVAEECRESEGCSLLVKFALPRGSFGTMVLREIMKPQDPVAAGF